MRKSSTYLALILCSLLLIQPVLATPEDLQQNVTTRDLPSSFDWRNVDGVDFTTPIKNQEPAPLCEAYALCAAIETKIQYKIGTPFGCDLSEAHLFFYSGGTCNWGVELTDAAQYLIDFGVPDEGCFPDPHRPEDQNFESLEGWQNRTVRIQEWGWVDSDERDEIKRALIEYGPLVVCILQRRDFLFYRGGIYRPGPGRVQSGHVVTIVGYDDNQQCWIIRNSAGTRWGEDGYARVAYSAHSIRRPFFWPFYGGTGILYIDGVSGTFFPDVPKLSIQSPQRGHTYLKGFEFPTVFLKHPRYPYGVPRILGDVSLDVTAFNTEYVEFYYDGSLLFSDFDRPFTWKLDAPRGFHSIEVLGYAGNGNCSKAMIDVYVIR